MIISSCNPREASVQRKKAQEMFALLFHHSFRQQTADDADDTVGHKNFMSTTMQTGFCDWSAKYFAQPVMKVQSVCFPFFFSES